MWLLVAAPSELATFYHSLLEAAFAAAGLELKQPYITQRHADGSPALRRLTVAGTHMVALLCRMCVCLACLRAGGQGRWRHML